MLKLQNLKAALLKQVTSAAPPPKKAQVPTTGHQGTSSFAPATPTPTALPWDPAALAARSANVLRSATKSALSETELTPDEDAQVSAAAEKVEQAYQEGGPEAASRELLNQSEALGSPHLVDALLADVETTVDAITADLAERAATDQDDRVGDAATLQGAFSLTAVFALAGEEGQELLVGSLGDALAAHGEIDLNQLDDRLLEVVQSAGAGFTGALATYLRTVHGLEQMSKAFFDISTVGIEQVSSEYESAQAEKAALDQRLAEDLAVLGPGMTEAEKAAYTEAFWADPEHAAVAKREAEAAERLSEVMETQGPELEARARAGDAEASKLLMKGWELLAKSPAHAEAAIEWSGRLACDTELFNAVNDALGGELESRLRDGLLCDALPLAQAALLNAHPDDPGAAADALALLMGPLATAEVFKDLKQEVGEWIEAIRIFSRLDEASREDIEKAKRLIGGFGEQGTFGKLLTGTVAIFGLVSASVHFAEGEWPPGVRDLLESVEGGYEVFGGMLNIASKLDTTITTKILPIIGIVLDVVQILEDHQRFKENGLSAGEITALFGGGLSLLGHRLLLMGPVPALYGTAAIILGDVIREVGLLLSGETAQAREARRQERDAFMEAAGISAERRERLLEDPFGNVQAGALGLTGPLFDAYKALVLEAYGDPTGVRATAFYDACDMAAVMGLEGEDALAFIEQVMTLDEAGLRELRNVVDSASLQGEPGDWLIEEQQLNARVFLERHFPEGVMGPDGVPLDFDSVTKDDANIDYFNAWPELE